MVEKDITQKEVDNFKELLKYLIRLSDDGVTPLIEKQLKMMLSHAVPFFMHLKMTGVFPEIHRLTINKNVLGQNKRIHEIKYLKYPPADKVNRYGRCNLPGQSIFYGAFDLLTVLSELKPRIGDLITKSIWRVKDNQSLTFSPIFKNQPVEGDVVNPRMSQINHIYEKQLKGYPQNTKMQIDTLVQFIADAFTKTISSKNHLDYIFSAYFSDRILNDFSFGEIEAIYYPSVQQKLSFENLAIKPDSFDNKYQLEKVSESVIVMDPSNGKGGYFMEGIADCKSFDYASDQILWNKNKFYQPPEKLFEYKLNYNIDLS